MRRNIATVLAVVLVAGLIAVLIAWQWMAPTLPPPLLLPMTMAASNAVFGVYPGSDGAMFILPDGSLWRWGHDVKIPDGQPELFDDRHHWAKVFARTDDWLEQETNGNVWEGRFGAWNLVAFPATNQDWAELAGGVRITLGLQKDGTIWGWMSNNGELGAQPIR